MCHKLLFAVTLATAPWLAAQNPPLPDGKGKEKVQQFCTACHGTEVFATQRLTRKEWAEIIEDMKRLGLDLKKAEYDEILSYLAEHMADPAPKPK